MAERLTPNETRSIFNQLQQSNLPATLPVRGTLWNIIQNRLSKADSYIDVRKDHFQTLACVEINGEDETSESVVFHAHPHNSTSLCLFLEDLYRKRNWSGKQVHFSLMPAYLELNVRNLFPDDYIPPSRKMHLVYDSNPEISKLVNVPKPPVGLVLDTLKPNEASIVAKHWDYPVANKEALFRKMILSFPNACLRNSDGQPVAWGLEYSNGAGAARHTLKEYRGQGLDIYIASARARAHYEFSPVPFYAAIEKENVAAIHLAKKAKTITADLEFVWLTREPATEQWHANL